MFTANTAFAKLVTSVNQDHLNHDFTLIGVDTNKSCITNQHKSYEGDSVFKEQGDQNVSSPLRYNTQNDPIPVTGVETRI